MYVYTSKNTLFQNDFNDLLNNMMPLRSIYKRAKCIKEMGHLTEKLTLLSGVLTPAILNLLRLDPGLRFEFLEGEPITDTLLSSFVVDSSGSGSTVSLRILHIKKQ